MKPMKLALLFLSYLSLSLAQPHFYYVQPLPAKIIQGSGLPDYLTATAKDALMINVRLLKPGETYRLRLWYTAKLPSGVEVTYPAEVLVKANELWATVALIEFAILDSEFVRISFKEESEPPALAESTIEARR